MEKKPQISATISKELNDQITEMSEKENRSISQMVAILLQQAVKERLRKRRGKENNPEHNSADIR